MRASGPIWSSCHSPRSPWVMRPCGDTATASVITMPAPPCANLPRWTRCQSFTRPSVAEYWHIGEITMRFLAVMLRIVIGWNRGG